jgi:coenzyme F420-reducing hydrogenase alpha subunit
VQQHQSEHNKAKTGLEKANERVLALQVLAEAQQMQAEFTARARETQLCLDKAIEQLKQPQPSEERTPDKHGKGLSL